MRRSLSRFLRLQKESHGLRLSSFAKFSGTIIRKKKQHGKEKMIFGKTTLTYLLANPNLEGKIHLKGVRFVTSLKSCFKLMHIIHASMIIYRVHSKQINSKTRAYELIILCDQHF